MYFLNGTDGSIMFSVNAPVGGDMIRMGVADLNDDGIDDVITGQAHIWAIDPANRSVLYNSTVIPSYNIRWLWVEDFDADSIYEVLYVTEHGVYLEEFTSGRVIWSYDRSLPEHGSINDAMLSVFDGDRFAVGICTSEGVLVVIDALTGVVIYFDGDDSCEIGGFNFTTSNVRVINEVVPWIPEPPVGYEPWTLYWNLTINPSRSFSIRGLWTYDVDSDGIAEAVILDSDGMLWLYSPVEPMPVWKVDFGAPIRDVKFADFGGDTTLDLLVLTYMGGKYRVLGLDGSNGNRLTGLDEEAPTGTRINVIAAADFTATLPGMEYAVVYTTDADLTYVFFYDKFGSPKYASSFNATSFYPTRAVVSNLQGDPTLELLVAGVSSGTNGDVFVWQGDGAYVGSLPAGYPLIVDVQTGNFDGDAYGDLALAFEDGVVWAWELFSAPFWQVNMNATVSSLVVANMDSTPTDEIVVNTNEEGIIVCDGPAFGEKWRYNALTTVPKKVAVADMEGDGVKDIVIMLEDHIGVIQYVTGDVIGAYTMTHSPLSIHVGNFDNAAPLDLMYYYAGKVYCITDHTTPPLPIPDAGPLVAGSSLLETAIVSGIVALPLVGVVVSVPMYMRRRRQH
jgi:hypothetical protein